MQHAISTIYDRINPISMHLNSDAISTAETAELSCASLDLVNKLAYHSQLSGWLVFIDPPAQLDCTLLNAQGVDCRKILIVRSSKTRSKARCLELALESIHTRLVVCDIEGLQGTSLKTLKQAAKMGMGSAILLDTKDMTKITKTRVLH